MIAWVYGVKNFLINISEMFHLPKVLEMYWSVMWLVVSPVILTVIVILKWVEYSPMYYKFGPRAEDEYTYPAAVQALGWFFELSPTVLTILYPLWVVHRSLLACQFNEFNIFSCEKQL